MTGARFLDMHLGHDITVTDGPAFGRIHVDCSCGLTRVCASRYAAHKVALLHHHAAGGCNCPEHVVEHDAHPSPSPTDPGSSPSRPDVETTASTTPITPEK